MAALSTQSPFYTAGPLQGCGCAVPTHAAHVVVATNLLYSGPCQTCLCASAHEHSALPILGTGCASVRFDIICLQAVLRGAVREWRQRNGSSSAGSSVPLGMLQSCERTASERENMHLIDLQRHRCCNPLILQGRCYGTNNSVVVVITDSCPECESYHMDMQALTFAKVGTWVQSSVARAEMQGIINGSQDLSLIGLPAVLAVPPLRSSACRVPPCSVV